MIYKFDLPNGGVIYTGEGGNEEIKKAITISVEEFLESLNNEPELQEEITNGKGIKWQIENATNYTYNELTKEKLDEIFKDIFI